MDAHIAETVLIATSLLFALVGVRLAVRGVKRDLAALEQAAGRMIGVEGEPGSPYALQWTIADEGQRAVGALHLITDTLKLGQRDILTGAVFGALAAVTASASGILAIWA